MLRFLPPTPPVLQQIRLLQFAKSCCRKYRVVLLFASVYVARFTGPRQTCFAASNVTPLYGVTPAQSYPIRSQYLFNLQQSLFVSIQV